VVGYSIEKCPKVVLFYDINVLPTDTIQNEMIVERARFHEGGK
jgi:hypothetical protein